MPPAAASRNSSRSGSSVVSVKSLFELVDDEHELGVVGEDADRRPSRRPREPCSEPLEQRGSRTHRDREAGQPRAPRAGARRGTSRRRTIPCGPPTAPRRIAGHQSGAHDRGLPAAARTHDREEPCPGSALAQPGDEPLDQARSVRRSRRASASRERPKSLVRVARVRADRRPPRPTAGRARCAPLLRSRSPRGPLSPRCGAIDQHRLGHG